MQKQSKKLMNGKTSNAIKQKAYHIKFRLFSYLSPFKLMANKLN